MLNVLLTKPFHVVLLGVEALVIAIVIMWILDLPVTPAY
jgi:hypothetical protein